MGQKKTNRRVGKLLSEINDRIELPSGILSGGVHIELNSNREMLIDGKCSIMEYTDETVILNTQNGILKIAGAHLDILSMSRTSAVISGKIISLQFSE